MHIFARWRDAGVQALAEWCLPVRGQLLQPSPQGSGFAGSSKRQLCTVWSVEREAVLFLQSGKMSIRGEVPLPP